MAESGQEQGRAPRRPPPWNWRHHRPDERRAELDDLATWILELQVKHGRWVRLPACWPCHAGLLEELAAFWYWRQRLDRTSDAGAEENVRWYAHLRSAAYAWAEAYAGCRHESLGEIDERRVDRDASRAATAAFLDRVAGRLDEPPETRSVS